MQKTENKSTVIQMLEQWDAMSDYIEIKTIAQYRALIKKHIKTTRMSLDTETTGLDTITAECLGYSFSFVEHEAYWVTIKVDPKLKLLKRLIKKKTVAFFNAEYDLAIVEKYGVIVETENIVDIMTACFFRDVNNYERNAGLKAQAQLILSLPTVELKHIIAANKDVKTIKKDEIDFLLLTPWQQRVYGCQDADITFMLWENKEIQQAITAMPGIWDLEHELIQPVMSMYKNGVGIDVKKVIRFDQILERECEACNLKVMDAIKESNSHLFNKEGEFVSIDEEFTRLTKKKGLNLGSFKQKGILLFEILGLPTTTKTKTGYSTDQESLASIENEHPAVPIMMQYTRLKSRRSNYTKKLPGLVNEKTGRIHCSLWHTGVKSGRFSASNPNMLGVSKDQTDKDPVHIREVFVPAKGNVITAADFSQVELRIAASLSQEPVLCDAYMDDSIDVHIQTAAEIYNVPYNKVTKDQRQAAKTANFSILNGISGYKLSAKNRKVIPTTKDGNDLIERWFSALPVLTRWMAATKRLAHKNRSMKTFFGRIRPFPEIKQPDPARVHQRINNFRLRDWAAEKSYEGLYEIATRSLISGDERAAVSHIIQGTAADIMKIAIVRVDRGLIKSELPVKMLLTVHDELLFEHPRGVTKKLHALLYKKMAFKQVAPGWVPLTIDIGTGKNWAEAH